MNSQSQSLVKYDVPILISTSAAGGKDKGKDKKHVQNSQTKSQTDDLLNSILPPREWTQEDQLWVQYVSPSPATRVDVTNLRDRLDNLLLQRQARETGICPIREELYAQCFDEIIRQVTINCAERGLLLLRVRDEIRMTICAYQSLYESSIAFGMRKALQAEQRKNQQAAKRRTLETEIGSLESQIANLEADIQRKLDEEKERRSVEEKEHTAYVDEMKKVNANAKFRLEEMLQAPAKK